MSMPETSVYKHRGFDLEKYKIRFPEKLVVPSPSLDAMGPEKSDHPELRRFVAIAFHLSHDLASLLFGKYVGHLML